MASGWERQLRGDTTPRSKSLVGSGRYGSMGDGVKPEEPAGPTPPPANRLRTPRQAGAWAPVSWHL